MILRLRILAWTRAWRVNFWVAFEGFEAPTARAGLHGNPSMGLKGFAIHIIKIEEVSLQGGKLNDIAQDFETAHERQCIGVKLDWGGIDVVHDVKVKEGKGDLMPSSVKMKS